MKLHAQDHDPLYLLRCPAHAELGRKYAKGIQKPIQNINDPVVSVAREICLTSKK